MYGPFWSTFHLCPFTCHFCVCWICSGWIELASPSEGFWAIRLGGMIGTTLVWLPFWRPDTQSSTISVRSWCYQLLSLKLFHDGLPCLAHLASSLVALAAQIALVWVSAAVQVACAVWGLAHMPVLPRPCSFQGSQGAAPVSLLCCSCFEWQICENFSAVQNNFASGTSLILTVGWALLSAGFSCLPQLRSFTTKMFGIYWTSQRACEGSAVKWLNTISWWCLDMSDVHGVLSKVLAHLCFFLFVK